MRYLKGDATSPQCEGQWVIAHVCNDLGAWGSGFVLALSKRWPDLKKTYQRGSLELGTVQFVEVEPGCYVANMIAQRGVQSKDNPVPLDYVALDTCLQKLSDFAESRALSVHMPKIGAGLAGGDWSQIEPLIQFDLSLVDATVYLWE
jgi:O-acetyl-ADP-ribose deacetylase (regulator of RNase III)